MYVNEEYEIVYPKELIHLESEGILVSPQNRQYGVIGLREQIGSFYLLRIFLMKRETSQALFFIKEEMTALTFDDNESLSAFFQRLPGMSAFDFMLFQHDIEQRKN
ncbi:hypothetical protein IEO70_02355 [Bacillus sp. AGMB 02131]|uniref:Uncharacterized protein n=1 Tax=Peribacillus faecalis TaxID=2772559 RepID=A0A927CU17_9BACI|nr:hypothetical protein [Peribacillus faecalis]MBD3107194.1 hypothetical protein [Peribacillus faecalis]